MSRKNPVVDVVPMPPGVQAAREEVEAAYTHMQKCADKSRSAKGRYRDAVDALMRATGGLPLFDKADDADDEPDEETPPEP